ncbi:hypothetical protein QUA20_09260 [Microcoleus sp. Pol7_A1]|uniref:hypothetical protein n=1 Tax=Microcoleus sp. Pol7_A1 TaxID=2818893 RepID=UPI002FD4AF75
MNFPVYLGAIGYKVTERLLVQGKVFILGRRNKESLEARRYKLEGRILRIFQGGVS